MTVTVKKTKKGFFKTVGSLLAVGVVGATLVGRTMVGQTMTAQTMPPQALTAARYDNQIQTGVAQRLAAKSQFRDVQSSVEDGIVTLTGTVDLYQRKLDAAKLARKTASVQGVRNLITVAGPTVPDERLEQKLAQKLRFVRFGYDITFDYFALGVKDGLVTVEGQDRTGVGRDEALADIANTPGVKDVIANISIEPVSNFDDGLRIRAARALYRDPVLSKYAIDPARPIRIIVDNGRVTLFGSVDSKMDKEVAGLRASQLFGAFTVENKLVVEGNWGQSGM
ncbi:MAG TPA: BON domain-containing protein [Candidatus Sulfotelmatobacter sp.]|nr:BON domain-containing protein [Candidatus Sulfotelmatobacter sp.]